MSDSAEVITDKDHAIGRVKEYLIVRSSKTAANPEEDISQRINDVVREGWKLEELKMSADHYYALLSRKVPHNE